MKTFINNNLHAEIYSDIYDFQNTLKSRDTNKTFTDFNLESQNEESKNGDFYLTENYEQADDLLIKGYSSGAEQIVKKMESFKNTTSSRTILNIVGAAPCVGAVLSGHPLNMFDRKRVATPCKEITINYERSVSGLITADEVVNASAKLLDIIKTLEKNNVRVKLNILVTALSSGTLEDANQVLCASITVKESKHSLNIMKIAYPLIHPSFQRRHIFRFRETYPKTVKKFRPYYGYSISSRYNIDTCRDFFINNKLIKKNEVFITAYELLKPNANQDYIIELFKNQIKGAK